MFFSYIFLIIETTTTVDAHKSCTVFHINKRSTSIKLGKWWINEAYKFIKHWFIINPYVTLNPKPKPVCEPNPKPKLKPKPKPKPNSNPNLF